MVEVELLSVPGCPHVEASLRRRIADQSPHRRKGRRLSIAHDPSRRRGRHGIATRFRGSLPARHTNTDSSDGCTTTTCRSAKSPAATANPSQPRANRSLIDLRKSLKSANNSAVDGLAYSAKPGAVKVSASK